MVKWGIKILHGLIVLIVGIAFIGVNVQHFYCCNSEDIRWEVKLTPGDNHCPCAEKCCCYHNECQQPARHNFYKITDFSKVEQNLQIVLAIFCLPEYNRTLEKKNAVLSFDRNTSPEHKLPDKQLLREFLCTYLC